MGHPYSSSQIFTWDQQHVFLTGSTGFIGRELLLRLLQAGVPRVFLLIRGADAASREEKLDRALSLVAPDEELRRAYRKRLIIVDGDIKLPRLGMSREDYEMVVRECNHVMHTAANVNFATSLQDHLLENLYGTRHSLDLAEDIAASGVLKKYDYVGTAYVAGKRKGLVREDELAEGQEFNNSYEHSKYQSELEVLRRTLDLPVTRHRPSVVMGDDQTGRTSNFKMMYWLAKIYADGWWRHVPANPEAVIDIVPVNFVVDAIVAISPQEDSVSRAYHIAAGPGLSASTRELADLTEQFFKKGKIIFVPEQFYHRVIGPLSRNLAVGKLRRILSAARVYEPYFSSTKVFDTYRLQRVLDGTEISCQPVRDYFHKLFTYCIETDWGRHEERATWRQNSTPFVKR